jgi:hypothetical protein
MLTIFQPIKQLLSNEDAMEIRYVKKVTDPTVFDPLFVEVLALQLALKLVMPLSQDKVLRREIYDELWHPKTGLMPRVRMVDKQEQRTIGRGDMGLFNDARLVGTSSGNPMKGYS